MIRITENFTLRRVAGQLAVSVGAGDEVLTVEEAKYAAEAFGIMAVMLEALDGDVTDVEQEELEEVA